MVNGLLNTNNNNRPIGMLCVLMVNGLLSTNNNNRSMGMFEKIVKIFLKVQELWPFLLIVTFKASTLPRQLKRDTWHFFWA